MSKIVFFDGLSLCPEFQDIFLARKNNHKIFAYLKASFVEWYSGLGKEYQWTKWEYRKKV